jgi:hypothetical protein
MIFAAFCSFFSTSELAILEVFIWIFTVQCATQWCPTVCVSSQLMNFQKM